MVLEYKATFKETDLIRDIATGIKNKFTGLSVEDSRAIATKALEGIVTQGNHALYEGLTSLGVGYAIRIYEKSGSERPADKDWS